MRLVINSHSNNNNSSSNNNSHNNNIIKNQPRYIGMKVELR